MKYDRVSWILALVLSHAGSVNGSACTIATELAWQRLSPTVNRLDDKGAGYAVASIGPFFSPTLRQTLLEKMEAEFRDNPKRAAFLSLERPLHPDAEWDYSQVPKSMEPEARVLLDFAQRLNHKVGPWRDLRERSYVSEVELRLIKGTSQRQGLQVLQWHQDLGWCRAVITLDGPGTLYTDADNTIPDGSFMNVRDEGRVKTVQQGDVLLLTGDAWHASPPSNHRLVLIVTFLPRSDG